MPTFRDVVTDALGAIKALAPGDDMTVDEINVGLDAAQTIILELHEARGPLLDVDIAADYIPGENQRVRVEDQASGTVTLPNSVAVVNWRPCTDYGFSPKYDPPMGSLGVADGVCWRSPRDGVRIEIVGATQATYFFRADLNRWIRADSRAIDDEIPLAARLKGHFAALVAQRLIDIWPDASALTPNLQRRIARANSALLLRSGTAHSPVRTQYF